MRSASALTRHLRGTPTCFIKHHRASSHKSLADHAPNDAVFDMDAAELLLAGTANTARRAPREPDLDSSGFAEDPGGHREVEVEHHAATSDQRPRSKRRRMAMCNTTSRGPADCPHERTANMACRLPDDDPCPPFQPVFSPKDHARQTKCDDGEDDSVNHDDDDDNDVHVADDHNDGVDQHCPSFEDDSEGDGTDDDYCHFHDDVEDDPAHCSSHDEEEQHNEPDDGDDSSSQADTNEANNPHSYDDCNSSIHAAQQKRTNVVPMSGQEEAAIRLLHILTKNRAPMKCYDAIKDWAFESQDCNVFDSGQSHFFPSRDKALKSASHRFNMNDLKPQSERVQLPNSKVQVDVHTFNLEAQICSLLQDPELMKDENLLFPDADDPFSPPPEWSDVDPDTHVYGDINTVQWYHDTWHARCRVHGRDVLCPLLIYNDKTHTDQKGLLCLEPVLFTLGIFNQKTRNNPRAWKQIGYILNMNLLDLPNDPRLKLLDYHYLLRHIIQPVVDLQQQGGFRWSLQYKGKTQDCVMRIPIFALVGDNEGQDKLCGHFTCRSTQIKCPCRKCNCPSEQLSSYAGKLHNPILQSRIKKLIQKGDKEGLQELSHHLLTNGNAFDVCDFGVDGGGGVNQATIADIMHTIRQGLMQYAKKGLLSSLKLNTSERQKQHLKNLMEHEANHNKKSKGKNQRKNRPHLSHVAKELDKCKIFSSEFCKIVDSAARYWGKELEHQSDTVLDRMHFPHGITCDSKLKACEEPATILLFLILLVSNIGSQYLESANKTTSRGKKNPLKAKIGQGGQRGLMGSPRLADWVAVLQEELLRDQTFRSNEMTITFVRKHLPEQNKTYLKTFHATVNREEGAGLDIFKFHSSVHRPGDIERVGSLRNIDTEAGEQSHKEKVKAPAERTQRRQESFAGQVATRCHETDIISTAFAATAERRLLLVGAASKTAGSEDHVLPEGNTYDFLQDGSITRSKNYQRLLPWEDQELLRKVKEFMQKLIGKLASPKRGDAANSNWRLKAYNAIKVGDVRYRADPSYYTMRGKGRGWHDWAQATLPGNNKNIPIQLILVFQIDGKETRDIAEPENDVVIDSPGLHVLCHRLEGPLEPPERNGQLPHPMSLIIHQGTKKHVEEWADRRQGQRIRRPVLCVFPARFISGPCIGIPNLDVVATSNKEKAKSHKKEMPMPSYDKSYLFISPKKDWPSVYMRHVMHKIDKEHANGDGSCELGSSEDGSEETSDGEPSEVE